ncbi:MAG: trypsin [Bacteroidetes bacterium]|nr:MAG: trypsin [Bacteroidota bacterium]
MKIARVIVLCAVALVSLNAFSQNSESPYFLVQSEAAPGAFPLLSTSVDATITGPVANVSVIQSYRNDGPEPIEALYVFPASTRAAVYHMEMRIGTRVIKAKVMEKHLATQTYETAKREGKRASLLEQSRPNVFQMHVANILPGEEIRIEMKYTEFIIPEEQVYTFVYPTVVGPRYRGTEEDQLALAGPEIMGSDHETPMASCASMPTTTAQHLSTSKFDINIKMQMPVPIANMHCRSHLANLVHSNENAVEVNLDAAETYGGNKDFILDYTLAGGRIVSGIMTYNDGMENYFLCQVEAPKLKPSTDIVPREYIFIIDVSGSMAGHPLDVSKKLMRNLLSNMRPTDKFNILYFAGGSFVLSPNSLYATPTNIWYAFEQIRQMRGSGGTQLLPAIQLAMQAPKENGYSRSFVIVTDGYVTVEEKAFKLINDHLGQANFFAFGIGSSVNRFLIEGLAHVGRGEPFIVTNPEEADAMAARLKHYIEHPVLTDINITGTDVELYDIIPEHIPDLMTSRPIYFFGKYKSGSKPTIKVSGTSGHKTYSETLAVPQPRESNTALTYLWAREKIRYLSDFNVLNNTSGRIAETTDLGLRHNLLTKYTSFVAVDHEPALVNGNSTRQVRQPIARPQGISSHGVGFELEIDPVIESTNTSSITVDVKCDNKGVQLIVETALEVIMEGLTSDQIRQAFGMYVEFDLTPTGAINLRSGDEILATLILNKLAEGLQLLGIEFDEVYTVNVSVNYGETN